MYRTRYHSTVQVYRTGSHSPPPPQTGYPLDNVAWTSPPEQTFVKNIQIKLLDHLAAALAQKGHELLDDPRLSHAAVVNNYWVACNQSEISIYMSSQ